MRFLKYIKTETAPPRPSHSAKYGESNKFQICSRMNCGMYVEGARGKQEQRIGK